MNVAAVRQVMFTNYIRMQRRKIMFRKSSSLIHDWQQKIDEKDKPNIVSF